MQSHIVFEGDKRPSATGDTDGVIAADIHVRDRFGGLEQSAEGLVGLIIISSAKKPTGKPIRVAGFETMKRIFFPATSCVAVRRIGLELVIWTSFLVCGAVNEARQNRSLAA